MTKEIIVESAQWVCLGMLTMWALWMNLKLAIAAVRFVSRGVLREAWVNGRRADPPLVRVPRRAKHSRRQMACSIGGTIIPAGVSIKGVGWTDRFGRGWFAPDADYVSQHGYSFNYAMDPISLEGPYKGPSREPDFTRPGEDQTGRIVHNSPSRETERMSPAPRPGTKRVVRADRVPQDF